MKNQTIEISGAEVEILWGEGTSAGSLGLAVHSVSMAQLEEGSADGPCDGKTFTIEGKTFRLGSHDYEENGGKTTCTANIYAVED